MLHEIIIAISVKYLDLKYINTGKQFPVALEFLLYLISDSILLLLAILCWFRQINILHYN